MPHPMRLLRQLLLGGGCLLFAVRLAAQDLTVGSLVWFSSAPPPEELPKATGLKPRVPEELRKTDEIGYVIVSRNIDETGKSLSLLAKGTHPPLENAVRDAFANWTLGAAKRDGKRVATRVWLPVIFNPKSAAVSGPDATPRLLVATPALTQVRVAPADAPQVVRMKLALDATGALVSAEPQQKIGQNVDKAVREALAQWKFAPARQGGQPVAAELVVSVLCHGMRLEDAGGTTPPRTIDRVGPIYPRAMARYGIGAQVTLDFSVGLDGKAHEIVVQESDNPAFEEPAVVALRQWKFEPGKRNGQPAVVRMRQPITFSWDGGTNSAYRVEAGGDQSKLPAELRYDTPVKIRGVHVPVYPYALRREGVRGKVKAAMMIDPLGKVVGIKIVDTPRPEFAHALIAALESFKFDPAYRDGKPVPHVLAFEQEFGPFDLPDLEGDDLLALEKKTPDRILAASALDAPLKAVLQRPAKFPLGAPADVKTGEAVVECLIDKDGRVRLPRVKSASEEAFGYAAVQAVSTWWFERPLVKGKAAVVREEIPVRFTRSTAPAAGAKK